MTDSEEKTYCRAHGKPIVKVEDGIELCQKCMSNAYFQRCKESGHTEEAHEDWDGDGYDPQIFYNMDCGHTINRIHKFCPHCGRAIVKIHKRKQIERIGGWYK